MQEGNNGKLLRSPHNLEWHNNYANKCELSHTKLNEWHNHTPSYKVISFISNAKNLQ